MGLKEEEEEEEEEEDDDDKSFCFILFTSVFFTLIYKFYL